MRCESHFDGIQLDCPIDKNNHQVVVLVVVVTGGGGALDTNHKRQQGSKLTAEGGRGGREVNSNEEKRGFWGAVD